jgi:TrmH family RNA methyltransferase
MNPPSRPRAAPTLVRVRSENDVFQTLEALRDNRSKRNQRRAFVVEGVRAINQALQHGWHVEAFIHDAGRALSDWALGLLAAGHAERHIVLTEALMARLSAREETSELLACITLPDDDPARIDSRIDTRIADGEQLAPLVVLFDRPASPGNLGSLIRSCDALGADGVLVSGHGADVYDPECVRASTGSLFAVPTVRIHQRDVLERWLSGFASRFPGLRCVGADERGEARVDEHDFRVPTLLLLGNETWGLSAAWRARCDALVRIPMQGAASSLNVACAGSILLYEVARQRLPHPRAMQPQANAPGDPAG